MALGGLVGGFFHRVLLQSMNICQPSTGARGEVGAEGVGEGLCRKVVLIVEGEC